jgi:hypothetical protein
VDGVNGCWWCGNDDRGVSGYRRELRSTRLSSSASAFGAVLTRGCAVGWESVGGPVVRLTGGVGSLDGAGVGRVLTGSGGGSLDAFTTLVPPC